MNLKKKKVQKYTWIKVLESFNYICLFKTYIQWNSNNQRDVKNIRQIMKYSYSVHKVEKLQW